MRDETGIDELDVIALDGNVVLRDWRYDRLQVAHTMTPGKARKLAESLENMACMAEKAMPKL